MKCCVKSGDAILTVCPPFQAQTVSRICKSQLSWCQAPQRGRTSTPRLPPSVAAAAKSPVQLPSWSYIPSSTQCELWNLVGDLGDLALKCRRIFFWYMSKIRMGHLNNFFILVLSLQFLIPHRLGQKTPLPPSVLRLGFACLPKNIIAKWETLIMKHWSYARDWNYPTSKNSTLPWERTFFMPISQTQWFPASYSPSPSKFPADPGSDIAKSLRQWLEGDGEHQFGCHILAKRQQNARSRAVKHRNSSVVWTCVWLANWGSCGEPTTLRVAHLLPTWAESATSQRWCPCTPVPGATWTVEKNCGSKKTPKAC